MTDAIFKEEVVLFLEKLEYSILFYVKRDCARDTYKFSIVLYSPIIELGKVQRASYTLRNRGQSVVMQISFVNRDQYFRLL